MYGVRADTLHGLNASPSPSPSPSPSVFFHQARNMRLQALGITPLTGGVRGEREEREGGQTMRGRGGFDQDLSIEAARAILNAPEGAQESLILKPASVREEYRQGKLLQQVLPWVLICRVGGSCYGFDTVRRSADRGDCPSCCCCCCCRRPCVDCLLSPVSLHHS